MYDEDILEQLSDEDSRKLAYELLPHILRKNLEPYWYYYFKEGESGVATGEEWILRRCCNKEIMDEFLDWLDHEYEYHRYNEDYIIKEAPIAKSPFFTRCKEDGSDYFS